MSTKRIIVELNSTPQLTSIHEGYAMNLDTKIALPKLDKINLDMTFGIVQIPGIKSVDPFSSEKSAMEMSEGEVEVQMEPENSTYIVRAEIKDKDWEKTVEELQKNEQVKGVFSDVEIQSSLICAGSPPVGNHLLVERLLCVDRLKARGMTGQGVHVAIVDTGVNMAHLVSRGKNPNFNATWSWKPSSSTIIPGSASVGHGTMCAFDVAIAAPKCTLLDIALLSRVGSTTPIMSGFLSDAVKAYEHLLRFMNRPLLPGENRSLVVNNSWGMFHPSWDFPPGHPGNYSSNPNHPFNLIVKALEAKGADILFAAGNCGSECPDGRCQNVTNQGIYGANSHPAVISVAGIGTNRDRVGYSNRGPGKLLNKKPDITAYTHFSGSGVYAADGGTSAACPVAAGVVAAIRTIRPLSSAASRRPAAIKNLITTTAIDLGVSGFDYTYGYGLIDGCAIVRKLYPVIAPPIPFCKRYPRICEYLRNRDLLRNVCLKNPKICLDLKKEIEKLPPDINPDVIRFIREFDVNKDISSEILDEVESELANFIHFNDEASLPLSDKNCNCDD